MKFLRFLPALVIAVCLMNARPAMAGFDLCDPTFGIGGDCYADNYAPNHVTIDITYFSDCTFTTIVGGLHGSYHMTAHWPYFPQGWVWSSWGDTSEFRIYETDTSSSYQQLIDGHWVEIEPC